MEFDRWEKYIEKNYKWELLDKIEEYLNIIKNNDEINNKININTSLIKSKEITNENIRKSIKIILDKIKETNNHKILNNIIEEYKKISNKYNDIDTLYTILNKKTSLSFKEYFVNIFMNKFENIFNTLTKHLFPQNIDIKFENFDLNLFNNGVKTKYKSFSCGEKSNLNICLLFTLNIIYMEYGVNPNIIGIDEFLDIGLDQPSLENVLTLIKDIYKNKKVFVISHKNNMNEFSDDELIIEKRNNISIIKD